MQKSYCLKKSKIAHPGVQRQLMILMSALLVNEMMNSLISIPISFLFHSLSGFSQPKVEDSSSSILTNLTTYEHEYSHYLSFLKF
jgi:hypothetical protein